MKGRISPRLQKLLDEGITPEELERRIVRTGEPNKDAVRTDRPGADDLVKRAREDAKEVIRHWLITDKGDPDTRRLVDGETIGARPHYSRQTPGAPQWTRNGQNLVFITADKLAVWCTFRPTPGKATRADGLDAWENAMFRNEGPILSSSLIREAVLLSWALWGPAPKDGFITYVKPGAVSSRLPGYCYRRAGWRRVGKSKDGKPMFRAPRPESVPSWREWGWHGERGGLLRKTIAPANDNGEVTTCTAR